jgi:hypothetical protein
LHVSEVAGHLDDQNNARLEKRLRRIERSLHTVQSQLRAEKFKRGSRDRSRCDFEESTFHSYRNSPSLASATSSPQRAQEGRPPDESASEDEDIREPRGHPHPSADRDLGFLGPSSSAAALRDLVATQAQFKSILDEIPPEHPSSSTGEPPGPLTSGEWRFCQSRLSLGIQVLSGLLPKPLREQLLRSFFDAFDPIQSLIPEPWVYRVHGDLSNILELTDSGSSPNFMSVAKQIESNQSKKLNITRGTPVPIKWSLIGILFAMFALGARTLPSINHSYRPHGQTNEESRGFASRMRDLVGVCWRLSNPLERVEESSILLLYLYIMAHTLYGEFSKHAI